MIDSIAYNGEVREKNKPCAICNKTNNEVLYSQNDGNWQCFFCYTEWKKTAPVDRAKITTEPMDLMRRLNERLHKRIRQDAIDAECEALQAHRPLYRPWEQGIITEAIDALQEGNRFPECAPMARVMAQLDRAIDRDLEACRDILRRRRL